MTPPPRNRHDWSLFLDVDGTLLEIAETPGGVHVSDSLKELLLRETRMRAGALALVSGRSLADLDVLFAPLRLIASGQHGLERRDIHGRVSRANISTQSLQQARILLKEVAATHRGLLLEDKGTALALHYRLAPELEAFAYAAIAKAAEHTPDFHVQPGKCVWELKPRAVSKGTAIRDFMAEAPFAGRIPVFAGDDFTDEEGFKIVNELGGISILVGKPRDTLARFGLGGVSEVMEWMGNSE